MKSSKSSDRRQQKNVFLLIVVLLIEVTVLCAAEPSVTDQAKPTGTKNQGKIT
jgi:hypothetical protein